MAHGHGQRKIKLPDYKQLMIKDTPLEIVQEKLFMQGLKDPWVLNEAWGYVGGFVHSVSYLGAILEGLNHLLHL